MSKIVAFPNAAEYYAFRGDDKIRRNRLWLLPRESLFNRRIAYADLWQIRGHKQGTCIGLTFKQAGVQLDGVNMEEIERAIDEEKCAFLQEYDPARWPKPDDPLKPVIYRMEFFVPADEAQPQRPVIGQPPRLVS